MFMVLSSWPKSLREFHLMNVDWAPGGRQPSDQASRLGLWVRRKLAATIHIHHRHCYYYSARRLILILPSHEGWKAESIVTIERLNAWLASRCSRLCRVQAPPAAAAVYFEVVQRRARWVELWVFVSAMIASPATSQGRRNRGSRVSGCSPNFFEGGGAVLSPRKLPMWHWRWWLVTGGSHQHSFVFALYQINSAT